MKIGTFTFRVPWKTSEHLSHQTDVIFDIFRDESCYSAIPLLSEPELRIAQLPAVIFFYIDEGKPVFNSRWLRDSDLVATIVRKLKELSVIS